MLSVHEKFSPVFAELFHFSVVVGQDGLKCGQLMC